MNAAQLVAILSTAIATATPLVFACIGETITERAGVINLSAEGTIMLAAMVGFAVAKLTGSLALGFLAASAVGVLFAGIVAFGSLTLKGSQIAIGFVLALLGADLSSFLGNPFVRIPGPTVPSLPIPFLREVPLLGPLLFRGDLLLYASYALIGGTWFFFYRTRPGLMLRAMGEQPAAAFARGTDVIFWRGIPIGLGGSCFFSGFQGRLEPPTYSRVWLDCFGHRHLRRLEPLAGSPGGLPVRHFAVLCRSCPDYHPRRAHPSFFGGSLWG